MIVAATAAIAVAGLGALMTDIGPWYQQLKQPPWKPPDWAFGPIWTTIFALAAALALIGLLAYAFSPGMAPVMARIKPRAEPR